MNIDKIIEELCLKYRIGTKNIFSGSRKKEVVTARQILYKILILYGKTTTQIGRIMSRDHSSVCVGARKVDESEELSKYATYLYLKYRTSPEVSPRIDVRIAKKIILEKIKDYVNDNLTPLEISLQLDLSEKVVLNLIEQVKNESICKKIPNYKNGTYRTIYL